MPTPSRRQLTLFGLFLASALLMLRWLGPASSKKGPASDSFADTPKEGARWSTASAPMALAAAQQRSISPPPLARRDAYANAEVLEEETTQAETPQGRVQRRIRLIRLPELKNPLVLVRDDWQMPPNGGQPILLRQIAMVADHVLVKPVDATADPAEVQRALAPLKLELRRRMPSSGVWILSFADPGLHTLDEILAALAGKKNLLRYAEPDYLVHANLLPDDASFSSLWGMHNTGQSGGTEDVDIDAPEAWELSTGSSNVVVGIIDTGIDRTHPDLAANTWTNPGEIAGNGIDDDGNGYIDDVHGWDFANDDADPIDDHNHGTHCAGTIGAQGNNAAGVAGVCWQVSLAALKFLTSTGTGTTSDATEAIAYATAMGFDLTSNSWGGGGYSESLGDAIAEADAAGILTICAAGNESSDNDSVPNYPSNYSGLNVIAVASITRQDQLSSFSNYGEDEVDLAAPGSEILSTVKDGGYATFSGTSMATPHVAGTCALLKAWRPDLTHHEIRDILLNTTVPVPALEGRCNSGGRLNAAAALLAADDLLAGLSESVIEGETGGPFSPSALTLTLRNFSNETAPWTAELDAPWLELSQTTGSLEPREATAFGISLTAAAIDLPVGTHSGTLTLTNTQSGRVQSRVIQLRVLPPVAYENLLDDASDWTLEGEWEIGPPQGSGGTFFGHPDPAAPHSGSLVAGISLSGDYSIAVGSPQHATLGPVNLTLYHDAVLEFQRWLNADYQPWVEAAIEISVDGVTWTSLWDNGSAEVADSSWSRQQISLTSLADGAPEVWLRWRHHVAQSNAYPYSGWNLDDIRVRATPNARLLFSGLPVEMTEGSAPINLTVRADPIPTSDLEIAFTTSAPTQIELPAPITLPAGTEEITISLAPLDDLLADGSQPATLTAQADGYVSANGAFTVHDNETATLTLTVSGTMTESHLNVTDRATLTLPTPAEADFRVQLTSASPTDLTVPPFVIFPLGATSVAVPLSAPDNGRIDGSRTVNLTTSVTNWPDASASVTVEDDETTDLALELPDAVGEGSPPVTGMGWVRLTGEWPTDLDITLSTDLPDLIDLPLSITL
ncbi:MAG: S8 family serine peptidase, partial [Verrucomicrobiales bacterium]|nr:S8 family serine peptidase [Verrucomicrobiales bacterium]